MQFRDIKHRGILFACNYANGELMLKKIVAAFDMEQVSKFWVSFLKIYATFSKLLFQ